MIWVGIGIGWVLGALALWVYFIKSGLHRTRGEYHLAKHIGDGAMHKLCQDTFDHST